MASFVQELRTLQLAPSLLPQSSALPLPLLHQPQTLLAATVWSPTEQTGVGLKLDRTTKLQGGASSKQDPGIAPVRGRQRWLKLGGDWERVRWKPVFGEIWDPVRGPFAGSCGGGHNGPKPKGPSTGDGEGDQGNDMDREEAKGSLVAPSEAAHWSVGRADDQWRQYLPNIGFDVGGPPGAIGNCLPAPRARLRSDRRNVGFRWGLP